MAKLLCRLSHMPLDEKLDICELLDAQDIQYYETQAGFWGVGVAALWLSNPDQFDRALQKFDEYQVLRFEQATQRCMDEGRPKDLWQVFCQKPILFTLCLLVIGGILAISIYPFML
ncbi:MAG: hypothetical protein HRU20_20420 [Pseudomonadales bacterium]|nr:hypothetical protein [Pseudomonadales bacterium]